MSDSIKVAIKVRPLIKREKDDSLPIQWQVQGNSIISTDPEMKKRGDGGFYFDHIFNMDTTNYDVFDTIVKPIVDAAVNGFNGTVFAYGQTSSGKTYTMMGTTEELGVVPLAVTHMFDAISNTVGREFLLRVSYLEIYNERVNDLLNTSGTDLRLHEDGSGQVVVKCKEEITNCPENVLSIMKKGDKHRRTGETNMNERSSRSHTIFRITIESREAGAQDDGAIQVSQLNLVDLAGSERARQTGATGERFKEGRHINLSLSTLGLVIMQLSESQDNQKHVNFRDSKLTRLLQSSLGGNALTAIICAVTPAALEETQCTLYFACRAKSVKNKPQLNEVMSDSALLKRYARQLAKLNAELERIKNENRSAEVEEMESRLQEKDRINQLLEERIELLKTRIVSSDVVDREESFVCKARRRRTWGGPGTFKQSLPVFQPNAGLPTIKEMSPEKSCSRKSMIQSVDIMNQTFQTAFADFEIELLESERDREIREHGSDSEDEVFVTKRTREQRVTFLDDAQFIKSKYDELTPERRNVSIQTSSDEASPSTPKNVLRKSISELARDLKELREFTTLEKQVICQENHCLAHQQKISELTKHHGYFSPEHNDLERTVGDTKQELNHNVTQVDLAMKRQILNNNPEVRAVLKNLGFNEEHNIEHILTQLCNKVKESEKQVNSEKAANQKISKKYSDLQRQIDNITSEKNEYEYMSCNLRTEFRKKTAEFEVKIMAEETANQEALEKIAQMEKQIESITREKDKLQEINSESRTELNKVSEIMLQNKSEKDEDDKAVKKIAELKTQMETITAEKNDLKRINEELSSELNKKISELETQKNLAEAANQEAMIQMSNLEKQIEKITSEKDDIEHTSQESDNALKKRISELESKVVSEEMASQEATIKIANLEQQVEKITTEKDEIEHMSQELGDRLNKKISELESKVVLEETANQEATIKIAYLEQQIEKITTEKDEIQHMSQELGDGLNKKISELESKVVSEETANQEATIKIANLEQQIEKITTEKDEIEHTNQELGKKLKKKTSELESKVVSEETANQEATIKIANLEQQIEKITTEKDEIEHTNQELGKELNKKISELQSKVASEETANQEATVKISNLEKQIEKLTSEKDDTEQMSQGPGNEVEQKISELESKLVSAETANQEAEIKVSNLEKQIEKITSENHDLQDKSTELNEKISELETNIVFEQTEKREAREQILKLEQEIENIATERNKLDLLWTESKTKASSFETDIAKISELEKQMQTLTSEKNEFQHINIELNEKTSELESQITLEQAKNKEAASKIAELELQRISIELLNELKKTIIELELQKDHETQDNNLDCYIQDLLDSIKSIQAENKDLQEQLLKQSVASNLSINESSEDITTFITHLEDDKIKLTTELDIKVQELNEIKNDVQSLKLDIEKLQKTIYLLTTENMEMSTKLSTQKERSKEAELNLQKTVDDLYARISKVTDEKIHLESDLSDIKEELVSVRSKTPEIYSNEEHLLAKYQTKIDKLTAENITLSATIAEKSKELESIKESKSLLYDHECMYKDRVIRLMEVNNCLTSENNELSTDIMDKLEENDMLKQECDSLKKKLELSVTKNVDSEENSFEQLKLENNVLRTEVGQLKTRITMLSDENAKFSDNLLETMEDLDNSRSGRSCNNTLHLSGIFDTSTNTDETVNKSLSVENPEALASKVAMLQQQVNYVTRLNKKLSELKLSSCTRCEHLTNLNESRRALKLEAKVLNHKLEDLQRKFDRKCADAEALKLKANEDFNLSLCDTSLNSSFADGMNVSVAEERVQYLKNVIETLKTDHDKLSLLYKEKCNELEMFHDGTFSEASNMNGDTKSKKSSSKNENKLDEIQKNVEEVKDDIDELKKNNKNVSSVLNKFKTEKASLLEEINMLKSMNEELIQKASDNEISATTATAKAQILENELTNMSKEIEHFSEREKAIESKRLTLEVELEDLKAEKEEKDVLISNLHRTIDELNERVSSLKNELDLMTSQKSELIMSTEAIERQYKDKLEELKTQNEELEKEKIMSIEAEKRATLRTKELENDIERLQSNLTKQQDLCAELESKASHLETVLVESNSEKETLKQKLDALQIDLVKSKDDIEATHKEKLNSITERFEEYVKESEMKLEQINRTLNECIKENGSLTQEIVKLQVIEESFSKIKDQHEQVSSKEKVLVDENKKLHEELNSVRECMTKELKSLKHKVNNVDFLNKSANEIFIVFLQTIMSKEEEMMKTMRQQFEKDKQQLEEAKEQSKDAMKRGMSWVKELEAEIEKLQDELSKRERTQSECEEKMSQLQHDLRESNHEKEMLKEKMETLEADFNSLQTEFCKQRETDHQQEEAMIIAQKKEKEVQKAFRNKEIEFQSKIKSEEEKYEKRIESLVFTIESYKTKNMELKNNIEGLEANEKQLKNIIEANTMEMNKNTQTIHKMNAELEQLTDIYNEVNRDADEKATKIEKITALLKSKCDMLSEYKSKLEIILPDYELLQEQVQERKASIEKYKEEIEELKMDRDKQIQIIQDKLNSEEIKNAGMQKQLNELNNRNVVLKTELNDLKTKCEELQQENTKLEKKIRNSTSKLKAEAEMEELKDLNKSLQKNLEGASNRITELQDNKNQLLKDLVHLNGQYDLASQENVDLKKTLASYESRETVQNSSTQQDKYNDLLQEKNKIALELEGTKLLLSQRDRELDRYENEVEQLTKKNKELDNELEDYAAVIRERDAENARLEDKLYSHLTENKVINELEEKVTNLKKENENLHAQLGVVKMKAYTEMKQVEEIKSQNEKLCQELKVLHALKRENSELQAKINEYDNKLELKSNGSSSRSTSPAFEVSRRRHSRNEMYNQRRQLDNLVLDIDVSESDDKCQVLRKKIHELELEIVSKNGKIATLEMQIQSENFPYQTKCKDLEEHLLAYRSKNVELRVEIRKLQKAVNDVNGWDCDICRKWRVNRRDQSCQTIPTNTRLCSTNSGVIDDHLRLQKLEKEKTLMKELCRSRSRQIKELEQRIKELEDAQNISVLKPLESAQEKSNQATPIMRPDRPFDFEKHLRPLSKENVPVNLLDYSQPPGHRRNVRNNNQ